MSHFAVSVVVPSDVMKSDTLLSEYLGEKMEPFNENLDVPAYIEKERSKAGEYLKEELDKLNTAKQRAIDEGDENWLARLQVFIAEIANLTPEEYWDKQVMKYHDAGDLDEDGNVMSTYNPDSQWDWWRVGGRWDGYIRKIDADSNDNGFNFDKSHESIEKNSITIREYLNDMEGRETFAYLTSSGNWLDKGNMGWWGIVSDEKDDTSFYSQIREALEKENPDDYLVCIDCHI